MWLRNEIKNKTTRSHLPDRKMVMLPIDPNPSWKLRRRAVFGSLIFAALIILYVTIKGEDSGLFETLALGSFGLIGVIVAAYIGGAVYEDVKLHPQILDFQKNQEGQEEEIEDLVQ